MKAIVLFPTLTLGALVLGVIALILFAPRDITFVPISRVKAPLNNIRDNIRFFNRYVAWSPFVEQDPQQKNRV